MDLEDGKNVDVDQVFAVFDDKAEKVVVWEPLLKAKVSCEVVASQKGEKMRVIKFKRKNRYMRTIGFRQHQTVLQIKKVEFNG
jgi:ribosomal protein L21